MSTNTAITLGCTVSAGTPGTPDYDTGLVHEIDEARGMAFVGWTSGVCTWTPIDDLRAE